MRELTVNEVQYVSAGITRAEAGNVLQTYAAGIIGGAAVGALTGPQGILLGALAGAARVAVGGGISALFLGYWKLS